MIIDSVYFEITNRCNLNCVDCYNASGRNTVTVELPPEVLLSAMTTLYNRFGTVKFDFSGGEPTLYRQLPQLLEQLCARKEPFSYLFITNGIIRDETLYRLLETDRRFSVQFSIDGTDEASYSKMRGAGHFETVMQHVSSLRAINPVVCKMVVTRHNMDLIESYAHLIRGYGCRPFFSFVCPQGNAKGNWEGLMLTGKEKMAVLRRILQEAGENAGPAGIPYPTMFCPLTAENEKWNLSVKPGGSIMPCQLFDESERFSLGNAYDDDWDTIMQRMKAFQVRLAERRERDYGCSKCINSELCRRGCPAMAAIIQDGDLFAPDGECTYRRLTTAYFVAKGSKMNQEQTERVYPPM